MSAEVDVRLRDKLNGPQLSTLSEPGIYADGGGLYLRVRSKAARSWYYISKVNGVRREMGLGSAFDVSLAGARKKAAIARAAFLEGRDPIQERKVEAAPAVKMVRFGAFAESLIDDIQDGFRNEKHRKQWRATLKTHAKALSTKDVASITTDDVVGVLKPIWTSRPETASRVRGRIERVLDAAKAKGLRSGENPARWRGHLDLLLPRRNRKADTHHAALPFKQIGAFMGSLAARPAVAARALELVILTAARSGEVLGMRWSEVDFDDAIWTVPAERMKAGAEHQVPLSKSAIAALAVVKPERIDPDALVFAGQTGKPLSNMAMAMLLRRMEQDSITVHGFRSAFRDWAGETTSYPRDVIEMALAHTIESKAERAYRRGRALEKRRELMRDWAEYCGRPMDGKSLPAPTGADLAAT